MRNSATAIETITVAVDGNAAATRSGMALMRKLLARLLVGFVLLAGFSGPGLTLLHAQTAVAPPLQVAELILPFGHEPLRCLPGRYCAGHRLTMCFRAVGNFASHFGRNPDCQCRQTNLRC